MQLPFYLPVEAFEGHPPMPKLGSSLNELVVAFLYPTAWLGKRVHSQQRGRIVESMLDRGTYNHVLFDDVRTLAAMCQESKGFSEFLGVGHGGAEQQPTEIPRHSYKKKDPTRDPNLENYPTDKTSSHATSSSNQQPRALYTTRQQRRKIPKP